MSIIKPQLQKLIDEQEAERFHHRVQPMIINPAKHKPFSLINPIKKRLVFIGHLSGISYRKLGQIFNVSKDTVNAWIKEGYRYYPHGIDA